MSVSPVAMSVGLVSLGNAGCWLIMYGLAYSLIPYFIPLCGSASYIVGKTFPVSFLSDVFLVASVLAGMSVCPPGLSIWR